MKLGIEYIGELDCVRFDFDLIRKSQEKHYRLWIVISMLELKLSRLTAEDLFVAKIKCCVDGDNRIACLALVEKNGLAIATAHRLKFEKRSHGS